MTTSRTAPPEVAAARAVRDRIDAACAAAGREPESVRLLVVTKFVLGERIRPILEAGFDLRGENRVQEVVAKAADLVGPHDLHFLGHLQENKVNQLLSVDGLSCLQSLDSAALARRLQARLEAVDRTLDVLLQINVSGEDSKSGVPAAQAAELLTEVAAFDRLRVRGLMTIGLNSPDQALVADGFHRLAAVRDRLWGRPGGESLIELSMGMSGDFETAIACGSTMVRVGSAIFGPRPAR